MARRPDTGVTLRAGTTAANPARGVTRVGAGASGVVLATGGMTAVAGITAIISAAGGVAGAAALVTAASPADGVAAAGGLVTRSPATGVNVRGGTIAPNPAGGVTRGGCTGGGMGAGTNGVAVATEGIPAAGVAFAGAIIDDEFASAGTVTGATTAYGDVLLKAACCFEADAAAGSGAAPALAGGRTTNPPRGVAGIFGIVTAGDAPARADATSSAGLMSSIADVTARASETGVARPASVAGCLACAIASLDGFAEGLGFSSRASARATSMLSNIR